MQNNSGRAVFLEKDGTLIENLPYNADPEKIRLSPGAGRALHQLQRLGYTLFVVSNQSGIGRGLFDESALDAVYARLRHLLEACDVRLKGFYYCPHWLHSMKARYAYLCQCRKPAPGLLLQAASQHGLDLAQCWMIGDILDDVEAGRRAGCRTVLIDNGNETEWECSVMRRPHRLAGSLHEAADIISRYDGLHTKISTSDADRPNS
jgi:histidinol-phosphate phosphatase family protein